MLAMEIQDYARRLYEAHGAKALAEAAQKSIELEEKGLLEQAQDWRRIEAALKELCGPRAS